MASLQGSNPGRVVSVPAAMVAECMECLEEIATADMQASGGGGGGGSVAAVRVLCTSCQRYC